MPAFLKALLEVLTTLVDAAAGYYTSFASVGIVIYFIRTRQGYRSLPEAINERYGSMATLAFGLAVLFRLYQEVWSNALVVAGFYGDVVRMRSSVGKLHVCAAIVTHRSHKLRGLTNSKSISLQSQTSNTYSDMHHAHFTPASMLS